MISDFQNTINNKRYLVFICYASDGGSILQGPPPTESPYVLVTSNLWLACRFIWNYQLAGKYYQLAAIWKIVQLQTIVFLNTWYYVKLSHCIRHIFLFWLISMWKDDSKHFFPMKAVLFFSEWHLKLPAGNLRQNIISWQYLKRPSPGKCKIGDSDKCFLAATLTFLHSHLLKSLHMK